MAELKNLIVEGDSRLIGDTNAGKITASSIVKSGGTSSQFLKADGSVDSNSYATTSQIPTVNNATLTIQKNGTTVKTFTANASSNVTANITVPTKVSELTNDSGYTTNTGTITGVKMNGSTVASSGVADLGTVITSHQSIKTVNSNSLTGSGNVSVGTVTSVATGVGLTGGSITSTGTVKAKLKEETLNTEDSSRSTSTSGGLYSVEADKSGNLAVRVPWTDHTYTVNNGTFAVKGAGTQVSSTSANTSSNTSVDIVAGSNVTVTPDATNSKITIAATDTTYESKTAASGGTAVSLCTTGEKYTWNNKSNLAIGTTATTAAAGNHTHTTTLAADTGTSSITLSAGGKYKLTAGGTNVIFTMPASSSDNIFWATYNSTTYADITAAITAGKLVLMSYEPDSTHKYILTATYYANYPVQVNTPYVQFNAPIDGGMVTTRVWYNDSWNSVDTIQFAEYDGGVPAGRYQCSKKSSTGNISAVYCANGNIICVPTNTSTLTGTFVMTLDNFYSAFMKSIGGYTSAKAAKSAANKVVELSDVMVNSTIVKMYYGGTGNCTKYQFSYLSVTGSVGVPSNFTYGASSSGCRIYVGSSSDVTITLV